VPESSSYTGADLIADFIAEKCYPSVFLVTGGACAFIVDALGRSPKTDFVCFQHEQSAAMAADAIWRTTGKVGVTVATSGPGATNLITGIACSWFDSIPALHITGQVNQSESREALGAKVRQAGFQETDIALMVKPITKFAKKIESVEELIEFLPHALEIALDGRMGPVLLDIPMNIQKAEINQKQREIVLKDKKQVERVFNEVDIREIVRNAARPLVLIGAGAALSGTAVTIQDWCEKFAIPHVTSWGAMSYINRGAANYFGSIGVYGAREANWLVQASDTLLVFGSRLDNRQRTGNPFGFAPFAKIHVLDIDEEELKKYQIHDNYKTYQYDLKDIKPLLYDVPNFNNWATEARDKTQNMDSGFSKSVLENQFNPYSAVKIAQEKFLPGSIVVSDCGANLCWVYQSYQADDSFLFTAGGNSPMGYSLPAAIGAQLANLGKNVYCFIGDGGIQMNIQELQTIVHYKLPIKIFIQNNFGYGIIKQFQDAYFSGRHFATGEGYSLPNFESIANAYGIPYVAIRNEDELIKLVIPEGACIIDLVLPSDALITPKTEMNRFIHDQFPYIEDGSIHELPYEYPASPSQLRVRK